MFVCATNDLLKGSSTALDGRVKGELKQTLPDDTSASCVKGLRLTDGQCGLPAPEDPDVLSRIG